MTLIRRIPGQYLWPLLLLIGLCSGSIIALLHFTTSAQDKLEALRETRTLSAALNTAKQMARHDLQDYAVWDDAVRHISRDFDFDWVDDNIAAYLGHTQGYNVFALGPDGSNLYSFTPGGAGHAEAAATLGPSFVASLAAVHRLPPGPQPIISGFSRQGDRVYLYAVAAIIPLTGKVTLPAGKKHVLVIAEEVDPQFLAEIRKIHQLPAFSLKMTDGLVPITDFRGQALAYIDVAMRTPGTRLRSQIFPGLLVILMVSVAVAMFVLRQGSLAMEALRASQAQAIHHAHHDSLTGLPNRRVLTEHIRERLNAERSIALLYMDLDGFKEVNDLYGHRAGDDLLLEATARISAAAGDGALVARMGGDEFAVLTPDNGQDDAATLAQRIIDTFHETFAIAGAHVMVGVSIGVVKTPSHCALDMDELMRRADVAMYSAKGRGKNRVDLYKPEMDEGHDLRKRLEHDLRAAIEADGIDVAYQPIVSASTGEIVCVEALARWNHPREGSIGPDIFIPLAEMTGLISALGEQVLTKACRAIAPLGLDLSVNLSPAQFWDARLVDTIVSILEREGFPAERLELEITENYLLRRPDAAASVIEELRALGIRLALDDFGSGFASVGYLRQLKFDRLKIDKQFLCEATGDSGSAELLVAIVAIGRALRLEITAEGEETEDQAALVRACGCHRMQGWLFGRPMPWAMLIDYLTRMRRETVIRQA